MTEDVTPQWSQVPPGVKPGWVIASMCLAVVLVIASVSSLNVALPDIARGLGATSSQVQWIVDIFALVLAALLLPAGALGDKFGRRKVMLIGFSMFVVAGIWATFAGDVTQMLIARAVGGLGAALIFPGTLSTITGSLPLDQRMKGIGLWAAAASLGGTIGSIGAGALIEVYWFGSIFLALGIAAAAVGVLTLLFVPETNDPEHANLDPVGAVLSLVGIAGLVFAITEGPVKGWTDLLTVAGFAAALVGLGGFARHELRTARPLLDVRLFGQRAFRAGSISIFVQFLAVFGFFFTASQYLAFVAGFSPLKVGLAFLPLGPFVPLMSAQAGKWSPKFGRGPVGGAGLLLMAAGCGVMGLIGTSSPYWVFAIGCILFGSGMGLAAPPATEAIIDSLPPAKQGVASAVNDLSRELGGALGIAILGSAMISGYRRTVGDAAASLPPGVIDAVRDSAAGGYQAAADAGRDAPAVIGTIQSSVIGGYSTAMWASAGVLILGAIYVALRAPRGGNSDDVVVLADHDADPSTTTSVEK